MPDIIRFQKGVVLSAPSARDESGPERIYPLSRQAEINDMPRVWRDEAKRGTWVDGEFISDRQLALHPNVKKKIDFCIDTSDLRLSPTHFSALIGMCRAINNLTPSIKEASKAMNQFGQIGYRVMQDVMCGPLPDGWHKCPLCKKPKPENEWCQGHCAKWDPPWPTRKSRIGSLFYLGGMVCSSMLRKYLCVHFGSLDSRTLLSVENSDLLD